MDKEFEHWYMFQDEVQLIDKEAAQIAWNASKQHWLDKAVDTAWSCSNSGDAAKAIKELKE